MENTLLKVLILIDAAAEDLTIVTTLPITCLAEYRMIMESKFNKINGTLRYGKFWLDEDDGEIIYRFTYSIAGQEFTPAMFENYLGCCLLTPDVYYKSIARSATGSMTNQEKTKIVLEINKLACAINGLVDNVGDPISFPFMEESKDEPFLKH